MHPPAVRAEIKRLIVAGINDCEISRRTGVPRGTVRDIRRPTYVPRGDRHRESEACPRCWRGARPMRLTPEDYSELLGFYLGDGYISEGARTQRLRIALDAKYPQLVAKVRDLVRRCFPNNRVDVVAYRKSKCLAVSVYSTHLGCVFPQHGPGRKHSRRIRLEPWQEMIVNAEPWAFIRACIWTDGCIFINRTDVHRSEPYEYLSYSFANKSSDIVDLFTQTCDRVGVEHRSTFTPRRGLWQVRINRRASVAKMAEHVPAKA